MWRICVLLLLLLPGTVLAGDSTVHEGNGNVALNGYRKLFYKLILLHPKLNSPLEKALLQHYLAGSGDTYIVSNADFIRLQQTVPLFVKADSCKQITTAQQNYCYKQVDLNDDAYFGWALGTITVIYDAAGKQMISFIDRYDFNKKKKGLRKSKNEFVTGLFRLLAPKRAKSFLVSYAADAYLLSKE